MKSKTGAKVIAILSIIFTSILLIGGSIAYGVYYDDLYQLSEDGRLFYSLKSINTVVGVIIFWFLAWIGICALLFHGIEKRKHKLMLPYMILQMIGLSVSEN